jgi:hypothetical protein
MQTTNTETRVNGMTVDQLTAYFTTMDFVLAVGKALDMATPKGKVRRPAFGGKR